MLKETSALSHAANTSSVTKRQVIQTLGHETIMRMLILLDTWCFICWIHKIFVYYVYEIIRKEKNIIITHGGLETLPHLQSLSSPILARELFKRNNPGEVALEAKTNSRSKFHRRSITSARQYSPGLRLSMSPGNFLRVRMNGQSWLVMMAKQNTLIPCIYMCWYNECGIL